MPSGDRSVPTERHGVRSLQSDSRCKPVPLAITGRPCLKAVKTGGMMAHQRVRRRDGAPDCGPQPPSPFAAHFSAEFFFETGLAAMGTLFLPRSCQTDFPGQTAITYFSERSTMPPLSRSLPPLSPQQRQATCLETDEDVMDAL